MRIILPLLTLGSLPLLLAGCPAALPTTPNVADVNTPAIVDAVLATPSAFEAAADHPLQDVEPGTVTDDLATLTGCWAATFAEDAFDPDVVFFIVYQFNDDGTFTRTSFFGRTSGTLLDTLPLITIEEGTYEVTDTSTLAFTYTGVRANVDANGLVATDFRDLPLDQVAPQLADDALVTLSGDAMLLYAPADAADEAAADDERPIYFSFDCP